MDSCINILIQPKAKPIELQPEEITSLNKDDVEFIKSHSEQELIQRNKAEIEWISNYPWVKNTSNEYKNYPFTSAARQFNTKVFRLTKSHKTVALIYLRRLNHELTIPFIYYEADSLNAISQFIYNNAVEHKCINITTYNTQLIKVLKGNFTFIVKRELSRDFAYHKSLQHLIKNTVTLQDGDADVAFC